MFDSTKEFSIPILSGHEKRCICRYPTDEEWCARARKQRSIRHMLGRGKSKSTDAGVDESNVELFKRIRIDTDGEPFDAADAGAALDRLERARVLDVDREGEVFVVTLQVAGARVVHRVKMPTQAQLQQHERESYDPTVGRRSVETRVYLEPSGRLYDALAVSQEGYASPVPVPHKVSVIAEVIAQLSLLEEDEDPEG